ncbi:MAG: ATP-binding cassette domain-containing protein [Candidatus Latescibacteria bacterium]|jgi:phospholipid/cholesterol/gamma-HCH transport system ATP-binding protein|nr:ATP-binding cassette domain-containing protein [Candidatus Latescibacterota bacterium]
MIRVQGLSKTFGNLKVLDDLSLTCSKGEITAIIGGSGGGKSTFLKMLVGAVKPDSGEIWVDGSPIHALEDLALNDVRRKMGVLFQQAALFKSITVAENVALPLVENTDLDESVVAIIVKMKLDQVGLSDFDQYLPSQLSSGMQRLVGLARAIALDPKIVLYDAPTAGLDPIAASAISKLIKDLNQVLGITSILVTHDIMGAVEIADHMALMYQGRILHQGSPEELLASPEPSVRQFMHGDPDGPIQFRKSREEYEKALFEEAQ